MAELTAFVREVILPGSSGARPRVDPSSCRFKVKAGRSPIHRWGLFAAVPIPARRRVIEYTGERIGLKEAWRRRLRAHLYLFWTGPRRAIDGAIGGSGAEYVNHACVPNLIARIRRGRILFVSLRRIAAGEELLLDYKVTGDVPILPCRCGAATCRGYMNRPPSSKAEMPAIPRLPNSRGRTPPAGTPKGGEIWIRRRRHVSSL